MHKPLGLALLAAVVLGLSACASSEVDEGATERTISGNGVNIKLPAGWSGRVFKGEPEAAAQVIAANFSLPAEEYYLGPETARTMQRGSIHIHVGAGHASEHLQEGRWVAASLPITVSRSDFGDFEGVYSPVEAVRWLVIDGQAVLVIIGFGTEPDDATIAEANTVLASLSLLKE